MLELKNPHSVLAAIRNRPRDVTEIQIQPDSIHGAWADVVEAAKVAGIVVANDRLRSDVGGRRQQRSEPKTERVGVGSATVRENSGVGMGELLSGSDSATGLWLALDTLQDPHNVGAIFRTAGFFGVRGVIISRDRSAPLNSTVYDVSAGGMEAVPFCVVPNLSRALDQAKKQGLWLLGTSEHASDPIESVLPDRPWMVVVGNEEKGLRRLTIEKCDVVCGIPPRGPVTSLNVSVAAAVLISRLAGSP
ncbi:MAG: 23S rRNA (guanosine(2251)-2'-O)-methyltransferase RlmB [Planctomycetota bacterium]|nr:23S rRNA (guanosine(2251)-2'-O)-methyltransferase RlmB [Planctomycetota bacterium]MDA1252111.1 23S rRNA (guanosine(2251)-2'-O)-methyltransferase RlmB [Planctomycetota bacterium]